MAQTEEPGDFRAHRLSVAPMMDWTDRHCRFFHRQFTRRTLLYTEMITARAVIHGNRNQLLQYSPSEHPLALQLGGSDPEELSQASLVARSYGFDEINLNVGCPSDRVRSGHFGATLMQDPDLVAECVAAMKEASGNASVTVKCRIGVDDQEPEEVLPNFIQRVSEAGIWHFIIHARKAWLQGLSPKENRTIPPLDYGIVSAMKTEFPRLEIVINGGIASLSTAQDFLNSGLAGVMIGRAAYHDPAMLGYADKAIFDDGPDVVSPGNAVRKMLPYIELEVSSGTRLNAITRHMLGAFHGRPGARSWRRVLSEGAHRPSAGPELVENALRHVEDAF